MKAASRRVRRPPAARRARSAAERLADDEDRDLHIDDGRLQIRGGADVHDRRHRHDEGHEALTVDVTNPANRDKNDVDVYVTPAGGMEQKAFNSGDILVHDEAVTVPQAAGIITKSGAAVRLSTNFDKAFASDPAASCSIVF